MCDSIISSTSSTRFGLSSSTRSTISSASTALAAVSSLLTGPPNSALDIARGLAIFQISDCNARIEEVSRRHTIQSSSPSSTTTTTTTTIPSSPTSTTSNFTFLTSTTSTATSAPSNENNNNSTSTICPTSSAAENTLWYQTISFPDTFLPGLSVGGDEDGLGQLRVAILSRFGLIILVTIVATILFSLKTYWSFRKKSQIEKILLAPRAPSMFIAMRIYSVMIPHLASFGGSLVSVSLEKQTNVAQNVLIAVAPHLLIICVQFYFVWKVSNLLLPSNTNENSSAPSLGISKTELADASDDQKINPSSSSLMVISATRRTMLFGHFGWTSTTKEAKSTLEVMGGCLDKFQGPLLSFANDELSSKKSETNRQIEGDDDQEKNTKSPETSSAKNNNKQQGFLHRKITPHYLTIASLITAICCFTSGIAFQNENACDVVLPLNAALAGLDVIFTIFATPFLVPAQNAISVISNFFLIIAVVIAKIASQEKMQFVIIAQLASIGSVALFTIVRIILNIVKMLSLKCRNLSLVTEYDRQSKRKLSKLKFNNDDDDADDDYYNQHGNHHEVDEEGETSGEVPSMLVSGGHRRHRRQEQDTSPTASERRKKRRTHPNSFCADDLDENLIQQHDDDEDGNPRESPETDVQDYTSSTEQQQQNGYRRRRPLHQNIIKNINDDHHHSAENSSLEASSSEGTTTPPLSSLLRRSRNNSGNSASSMTVSSPRRGRTLVKFPSGDKLESEVHFYDRDEVDSFHEMEDVQPKHTSPALTHRNFSVLDSLKTVKVDDI